MRVQDEAPVGKLEFTYLDGDDDAQFWYHLMIWHARHGGDEVEERCEHGLMVTRCSACGAPVQITGRAECEHLLAALTDIPVGHAALLNSAAMRIDRVADGIPVWRFR